jgi:hypothetical protein
MGPARLEKRVAALEDELTRLKSWVEKTNASTPWWERIAGTFEDDPVYEKAMKLGRQYRRSLADLASQPETDDARPTSIMDDSTREK